MEHRVNELVRVLSKVKSPEYLNEVRTIPIFNRTIDISLTSDNSNPEEAEILYTVIIKAKRFGYKNNTWLEWVIDI